MRSARCLELGQLGQLGILWVGPQFWRYDEILGKDHLVIFCVAPCFRRNLCIFINVYVYIYIFNYIYIIIYIHIVEVVCGYRLVDIGSTWPEKTNTNSMVWAEILPTDCSWARDDNF